MLLLNDDIQHLLPRCFFQRPADIQPSPPNDRGVALLYAEVSLKSSIFFSGG